MNDLIIGLFHKAISQSGHSLNSEVVHPSGTARALAWDLARIVGCNTSEIRTSEELLGCLLEIPSITLARASLKLMVSKLWEMLSQNIYKQFNK